LSFFIEGLETLSFYEVFIKLENEGLAGLGDIELINEHFDSSASPYLIVGFSLTL